MNITIKITIKITITTLLYYLDNVARSLVPRAESPGDVDKAKVCDDRSTVLEEDVLRLQVLPTSNDFAGKSVSCTRTSCIMINDHQGHDDNGNDDHDNYHHYHCYHLRAPCE